MTPEKEKEKMSSRQIQGHETRQKLISIGARLFGLNGYNGVSMRTLSDVSGTNLATVSYHFGGKKGLYEAILYAILARKEKIFPSEESIQARIDMMETGELSDFNLISWFIKTFVKGLIGEPDTVWAVIIINRELAQPSELYHILEEKFFKPSFRSIGLMLKTVMGNDVDPEELVVVGEALMGISLKFVHNKDFLSRLGKDKYTPELIEKVTDILSRRAALFVGCQEK